jgi:hypothetical protein
MRNTTIDIEPTWEVVLRIALGSKNPLDFEKQLLPAIKIADVVRQAQKQGKKAVIFTFPSKVGDINIKVED